MSHIIRRKGKHKAIPYLSLLMQTDAIWTVWVVHFTGRGSLLESLVSTRSLPFFKVFPPDYKLLEDGGWVYSFLDSQHIIVPNRNSANIDRIDEWKNYGHREIPNGNWISRKQKLASAFFPPHEKETILKSEWASEQDSERAPFQLANHTVSQVHI